MANELRTEVEQVKKRADVKQALKQTSIVKPEDDKPKAKAKDKVVLSTHAIVLLALLVARYLLQFSLFGFAARYPKTIDVLQRLASAGPTTFTAPRPLGVLTWAGFELLLLEPLTLHGRSNRPLGSSELSALAELASLNVIPAQAGEVPVHGDFTAWNTGADPHGRLAVVDWEHAGAGLPLEDLFQWRLQQLVLFGVGSPDELVRGAVDPDGQVLELSARLGVDPGIAPGALLRAAARSGAVEPGAHIQERLTQLLGAAA